MSVIQRNRKIQQYLSMIATGVSIVLNIYSYFTNTPIYALISIVSLFIVLYYITRPVIIVNPKYQFDWNTMMSMLQLFKTTIFDEESKRQVIEYARTLSHCATIDGMTDLATQLREEADRLEKERK